MSSKKFRITSIALLACLLFTTGATGYIDTNRDTRPAPEKALVETIGTNGYDFLTETDTLKYYYRDDRDIFMIVDKRNGYTWKTGLDAAYSSEIKKNMAAASNDEELLLAAEPKEKNLNATYIGIANSLVTVEYSELETTKYISSASEKGASSVLSGNGRDYKLDVNMEAIDLKLSVYITLGEDEISYFVPFEEMSGEGLKSVTAVILTPFLGASGGLAQYYDPETGDYGEAVSKYMVPGYVLVPDGSGALIRFTDNNVAFTSYEGDVYGSDPSTETFYYSEVTDAVPVKDPVMPVFGIAHGNRQAAFVAYAESGAEYMDIIVNPEETKRIKYTYAYPRFEYNLTYYQVYNNAGSGYFTLMEEPNIFDVRMTYKFLAGDGSKGFAADYTGMALAYREHLVEEGILTEKDVTAGDIPMRADFLMSDVKKSVIGTTQVVTTTVDDVRDILNDLEEAGIKNVNSGLIGWQKKSETLAKPASFSFTKSIGSSKDFKGLMKEFAERGKDLSFSRNFTVINDKMLSYYTNAAKHVNTWYLSVDRTVLYPKNAPVQYTGYALPEKTAKWIETAAKKASSYAGSLTITGSSNILTATYDRNGVVTSLTDSAKLIAESMEAAAGKLALNLENPNMYLWKYTNRYLKAPVGNSQFVFESDTVPFLQLVLNGTMEMYAPYSNFSFYTQADILRMIDYNVYPSFVFTGEPSYLLSDTASSDMYSTEYTEYKAIAKRVYEGVNGVLSRTMGMDWTGREVLKSGLIKNTYKDGKETHYVIINYTQSDETVDGVKVPALSAIFR
ncbi:MAG: hypothetical protein K6B75_02110 [Lachnospiraceae bacterium]|nr:hypothetical protein [Lachnospiraceae bacterium]